MDIDHLRRWIGRTEAAEELLTPELVRRFRATLPDAWSEREAPERAPSGIHWCLAQPALATASLGEDGHPRRGDFLPPVPLPRRMWAGGAIRCHDPLRIGDVVRRRSWIADVAAKAGRSGPLCFVTVEHEFTTSRGPALSERQDIVYRSPAVPAAATTPAGAAPATWSQPLTADAVLLFRYSALTFNGHRIHYDHRYAAHEGYPDLVVHGPLQATLLLHFAERLRRSRARRFEFRALQPLLAGQPFRLGAGERPDHLELHLVTEQGRVTMSASAAW